MRALNCCFVKLIRNHIFSLWTFIPLPQLEVFDYVFLMTASAKCWCNFPSCCLCSSLSHVLSTHVFVEFFFYYSLSFSSLCFSIWHTHTHSRARKASFKSGVKPSNQQANHWRPCNLNTFWRHCWRLIAVAKSDKRENSLNKIKNIINTAICDIAKINISWDNTCEFHNQ